MSISKLMGIIFFISILGSAGSIFFLIYKSIKKQPKRTALISIVSCVVSVILFGILMTTTMSPEERAALADRQAQKQAIESAKKEASEKAAIEKEESTETATPSNAVQDTNLTPEQTIEKICKDIVNDNFIEIDITNNVTIPDGKTVFLKVKAKDSLTNEMARTGTLWQSRDIIKALYTSGLPIGDCKIVSSSTLVDKYGKKSEGVVMRCALDAKTAEKINWENADTLEWEKVLNEYWAHPSYKK